MLDLMPSEPSRFTPELLTPTPRRRQDVVAHLAHFALINWAVDPARVRPHVDERFELDTIVDASGAEKVLVSMVPFEDQDFHFVGLRGLRFSFGQTNYRTYVIDRVTRQRAVWFWGTTLDSPSVAVPRYAWRLPWYRGRVRFDCAYDASAGRYSRYRMTTHSRWAPVELSLADTGAPVTELQGYPDLEHGLVTLTHPLTGVFRRTDGRLGTYPVWHDRLEMTVGRCVDIRAGLLDRLGVVPFAEQADTHSVLIQPSTEFTVYLPPQPLL